MQADNQNADKRFLQKEEETAADISREEKHWAQMRNLLAPAAVTAQTKIFRFNKKWLIAAALIPLIIFFVIIKNRTGVNSHKNKPAINDVVRSNNNNNIEKQDSNIITPTPVKAIPISLSKKIFSPGVDVVFFTPVIKDSPIVIVPDKPAPDVNTPSKNLMADFYKQIQKPAEEFTMDAAMGGTINCKEGTVVNVPVTAFKDESGNPVNGKITIKVEEYYKYSDMIAANLTTTSDGRQLATGGMIKLTAYQNEKPIHLKVDKEINVQMPTSSYDPEMSLFTAREKENRIPKELSNSAADFSKDRNLNWNLSSWQSYGNGFDNKTFVMSMQDEPFKVRGGSDGVAIFRIPRNSPYSTDEAREILKRKYGDRYRKIIVRKIRTERRSFRFFGRQRFVLKPHIGDSTKRTISEALRFNYIEKKDSAFYAEKLKNEYIEFVLNRRTAWNILTRSSIFANSKNKDTVGYSRITDSLTREYERGDKIVATYSFQVKEMGWINCDRFYDYANKADFVIDLPADTKADNFISQLVFTNIRSVMPGRTYENKIGFLNIPQNMPVFLVGLGERNGKVVSFMEKYTTGKTMPDISQFEETTPEAFRKKLATLDL